MLEVAEMRFLRVVARYIRIDNQLSSSSECSAEEYFTARAGRNLDYSSAKGGSSTVKSGTKTADLPGIE